MGSASTSWRPSRGCAASVRAPRRRGARASWSLAERLFPHAPAVLTPMARHRVPGAGLALIADGELVAAWGQGVTGGEESAPVGPDTVFQACSVSKHVTALGVMRLVQEGRLDLDMGIGRHLTAWRPPEEGITLRRLLSHTAGLSVFRHPGYRRGGRVPDLRQVLDGTPPANTPRIRGVRPPGECHYSCGNYSVIEQVVVEVTGLLFAKAMRSPPSCRAWTTAATNRTCPTVAPGCPRSPPGRHAVRRRVAGLPRAGLQWPVGHTRRPGGSLEIHRAATGAGGVFLSQRLATEMITPVDAGYGLGTTTASGKDTHLFGNRQSIPTRPSWRPTCAAASAWWPCSTSAACSGSRGPAQRARRPPRLRDPVRGPVQHGRRNTGRDGAIGGAHVRAGRGRGGLARGFRRGSA